MPGLMTDEPRRLEGVDGDPHGASEPQHGITAGQVTAGTAEQPSAGEAGTPGDEGDPPGRDAAAARRHERSAQRPSSPRVGRFVRELVVIVAVALLASALLRAFVVQAYYVPSGSMLPTIELQDRILVSRIGDVDRGEVVVFEDPGGWIPESEKPEPPGAARRALEWIGVLPATGHEHLVKRVVGVPGDHVVCCNAQGRLTINGYAVDESDFLFQGEQQADNVRFDVVVPADHVFVLGDHRFVSGDSSRQEGASAFVPLDNVVGRAFAVIWPPGNTHLLGVPDAYDDVPDGRRPPEEGVVNPSSGGTTDR
jgi:signal peptidase I